MCRPGGVECTKCVDHSPGVGGRAGVPPASPLRTLACAAGRRGTLLLCSLAECFLEVVGFIYSNENW